MGNRMEMDQTSERWWRAAIPVQIIAFSTSRTIHPVSHLLLKLSPSSAACRVVCRHDCIKVEDWGHLHPFPSAAHSVAKNEEEDQRHSGGNSQRDKEVWKVVPSLQGLRGGVILPKFRQDAGAWFRTGNVNGDHFVDVDLKRQGFNFVSEWHSSLYRLPPPPFLLQGEKNEKFDNQRLCTRRPSPEKSCTNRCETEPWTFCHSWWQAPSPDCSAAGCGGSPLPAGTTRREHRHRPSRKLWRGEKRLLSSKPFSSAESSPGCFHLPKRQHKPLMYNLWQFVWAIPPWNRTTDSVCQCWRPSVLIWCTASGASLGLQLNTMSAWCEWAENISNLFDWERWRGPPWRES